MNEIITYITAHSLMHKKSSHRPVTFAIRHSLKKHAQIPALLSFFENLKSTPHPSHNFFSVKKVKLAISPKQRSKACCYGIFLVVADHRCQLSN